MSAPPWRLAASHTHLYPGARLRCEEEPGTRRLAVGDDAVIAFSDGAAAFARITQADAGFAVLAVASHRTARGTQVAARRWRIVPGGEPGALRVAARLAA